jgi:predicted alpha/beta-fold hydrolase
MKGNELAARVKALQPGQPVVILIHGLGGSHRSGYLQRCARRFWKLGCRVVRADLRGCGAGIRLARRPTHGGLSDDIRRLLRAIASEAPGSRLLLIGFSLGGNIVLKAAGEGGLPASLTALAAVAPPIDLTLCAAKLSAPRQRLYDLYFVNELLAQARQRERFFPAIRAPQLRGPDRSLRGFDDAYTAPLWGFADAAAYYRQQSSWPWLTRIQVPTLLLTAADDPFIAVEPFLALTPGGAITVEIQRHGGHLGFLGSDGQGGIRWVDARLHAWGHAILGLRAP